MTVRNAIEILSVSYPEAKRPFLYLSLDEAQKQFLRESRILKKVGSLQSLTTKTTWDLPSDVIDVYDVRAYNSSNEPLYFSDLNMTYEISNNKIMFFSNPVATTIDSSISTILIYYTAVSASLMTTADWTNDTALDTELEAPLEYHNGIISLAMSNLHSKFGKIRIQTKEGNIITQIDWQGVNQFKREYLEYLLQAKKDRNRGKDGTPYEVRRYDYAGKTNIAIPNMSESAPVSIT